MIFGPKDDFTNRFAQLIRLSPGLLPLPGADTRLQPVHVADVARAIVKIISDRDAGGQRYDIGGADIFSLREIVEFVGATIDKPVRAIALGKVLSTIQATVCEYIPGKPFSRDNFALPAGRFCLQRSKWPRTSQHRATRI